MSEETALATREDPQQQLIVRKRQAELLRDFIQQQGLSKNFGGPKDHIFYEGWAFLGELGGYYTSTEGIEELKDDDGKFFGVRATVNLKRSDEVVATVTASCTRDEPTWRTKPRFQIESMAQTRGASKAFRMRLSPIVALAGFNPTPAEEMDGVTNQEQPASQPTQSKPKKRLLTFDGLVQQERLPPKLVEAFLESKATTDDTSVDALREKALDTPKSFIKAFTAWFEAKKAQESSEANPPPLPLEEAPA